MTTIDRRTFLHLATATPLVLAASRVAAASPAWADAPRFEPEPGTWRSYEIVSRVEVLRPGRVTKVWLPTAIGGTTFQRTLGLDRMTGNGHDVRAGGHASFPYHYAEFPENEPAPVVEVTMRVASQDRRVEWSQPQRVPESAATLAHWIEPTRLLPTDGAIAATSREITTGANSDVEKVRAIYDWVVTHTRREPSVPGCGTGDAAALLASDTRGGKCADINGLFVALVRAASIPARDVYGIRVAPSGFGYRSLGAATETITKAQHCRAEVHLAEYGWVAMDPADVAKVAREETGEPLPLDDARVAAVRAALFGGWEGNWVAFNVAHDVVLPHAVDKTPLPFLMYPQAEVDGVRRDPLDADNFRYTLTARQIAS